MSKKRRQPVSPWSLGSVPLTPVEIKNPDAETRREANARIAREVEAERKAAEAAAFARTPEGQIQAQRNAIASAVAENTKAVAAFYSQDGERLMNISVLEHPQDFGLGNDFAEETKALSDYEYRSEVAPAFLKGLPDSFDLSVEGWARFTRYVKAQAYLGHFQITPEFMRACLERLGELDVFPASEVVSGSVPTTQRSEAKPVPVDQVSQSETEAERQKRIADQIEHGKDIEAKELVGLAYSRDLQNAFYSWLDENVVPVWGIDRDIMTSPRITKFIGQVLDRHPELNPLRPQTWDFVRRAIDYAQLLGPRGRYLTADERTAASLEDRTLTNATFETRRDITRRLQSVTG